MISALDRKLLRDLYGMWGQALAICLVIAAGVAVFVMSLSTLTSLDMTRQAYYERYRFADVFANLKRAPDGLAARIRQISGVARVQTRVVINVTLDVPQLPEPAKGRLIGMPSRREGALNDVFLRRGRHLAPGRRNEVLVGEAFAKAHKLGPRRYGHGDHQRHVARAGYRRHCVIARIRPTDRRRRRPAGRQTLRRLLDG